MYLQLCMKLMMKLILSLLMLVMRKLHAGYKSLKIELQLLKMREKSKEMSDEDKKDVEEHVNKPSTTVLSKEILT